MKKFFFVRFFSEVKVRRDRVFEKVNDQVPQQDQKRRVAPTQLETGWHHLDKGCRQHEASAEGHEVPQVAAFPVSLDDDCATEDIRSSSGQTKQDCCGDGRHSPGDDSSLCGFSEK